MKNTIGIHIWDGAARLAICDDESVRTAEVEFPYELQRTVSLTNEYTLIQALKIIDEFIKENLGLNFYDIVIAVPDSFGLKEIYDLKRIVEKAGMNLVRTVSDTLAVAYYSFVEFRIGGNVLVAYAAPGYLSLVEYKFTDGLIRKVDTYIAGRWKGSALKETAYLHPYSSKLLDATEAEIVFFSGATSRCLEFDQAMKNHVSSGSFINTNIEYEMIDSQCIIEGLGMICGNIEGRTAFQGLSAYEFLSPYDTYLSINENIYPVCETQQRIPFDNEINIMRIEDTFSSYAVIKLLEKRDMQLNIVNEIKLSKERLSDIIMKPVKCNVKCDAYKMIDVTISVTGGGGEITLPVYGEQEMIESAEEIKEETIEDFISKIIPIIDNLEYASKYATDPDNPYAQGIIQSYHKAVEILENNGVKIISGEGEQFDYNTQSAVAHVTDIELPENTVKQVMQTGYSYKGQVIRTASVIVAN